MNAGIYLPEFANIHKVKRAACAWHETMSGGARFIIGRGRKRGRPPAASSSVVSRSTSSDATNRNNAGITVNQEPFKAKLQNLLQANEMVERAWLARMGQRTQQHNHPREPTAPSLSHSHHVLDEYVWDQVS